MTLYFVSTSGVLVEFVLHRVTSEGSLTPFTLSIP